MKPFGHLSVATRKSPHRVTAGDISLIHSPLFCVFQLFQHSFSSRESLKNVSGCWFWGIWRSQFLRNDPISETFLQHTHCYCGHMAHAATSLNLKRVSWSFNKAHNCGSSRSQYVYAILYCEKNTLPY